MYSFFTHYPTEYYFPTKRGIKLYNRYYNKLGNIYLIEKFVTDFFQED